MKNSELHKLNFEGLLSYPSDFIPQNRYQTPLECKDFCRSCEICGHKNTIDSDNVLISHGCDIEDFTKIIGMPLPSVKITSAIMFLMEDPGGDYDLGVKTTIDGISKTPPTKHYYFSSDTNCWPENGDSLKYFYGPYYAYLMQKHGLGNVYITNCVKCKWRSGRNYEVEKNCIGKWLVKEMQIFSPQLVVCFGTKSENLYKKLTRAVPYTKLLHPSFIQNRWQTQKKYHTRQDAVEENDRLLAAALIKNGLA